MEEQLLHGGGGGSVSLLQHPTITSAVRPLITGELRRAFLGDDRDCPSYWKPIGVVDLVRNLAFVVASVVGLLATFRERPSSPLRVWVSGYALRCLLHVGFVYLEFRYWNQNQSQHDDDEEEDVDDYRIEYQSIAKRLESVNTITSIFWWVLGFYWLVLGGQVLEQDSPYLYWLTVAFLAFDVFYVICTIGVACIIFIALFCCIPVMAVAYAVGVDEGASEDDIRALPKYRFCRARSWGIFDNDNKKPNVVGSKDELGTRNYYNELALPPEDSECCICLCRYDDGAELYALPCSHHFHCGCITRWLRINATCPLCKFNILRADTLV